MGALLDKVSVTENFGHFVMTWECYCLYVLLVDLEEFSIDRFCKRHETITPQRVRVDVQLILNFCFPPSDERDSGLCLLPVEDLEL